jgi:hypothetical protein
MVFRSLRALLGVAAVGAVVMVPTVSQASTLPHAHAGAAATPARPAPMSGHIVHVTLRGAQCAALRRELRSRTASCSFAESLHIQSVPDSVYDEGYLQICGEQYEEGGCYSDVWWVADTFYFTLNDGNGVYNNGTPSCTANHTGIRWCGYTNNGQATLSEGVDFGDPGDWARMYINQDGTYTLGGSPGSITGSIAPA